MIAMLILFLETVVLHVGGFYCSGEKVVVERVFGRRFGVLGVDANPVV